MELSKNLQLMILSFLSGSTIFHKLAQTSKSLREELLYAGLLEQELVVELKLENFQFLSSDSFIYAMKLVDGFRAISLSYFLNNCSFPLSDCSIIYSIPILKSLLQNQTRFLCSNQRFKQVSIDFTKSKTSQSLIHSMIPNVQMISSSCIETARVPL